MGAMNDVTTPNLEALRNALQLCFPFRGQLLEGVRKELGKRAKEADRTCDACDTLRESLRRLMGVK